MEAEGVVLAAGLSSRAGTNKLFLELGGKSVLLRCLDAMGQVCSRIIVVGGHQFHEVKARLKDYPRLRFLYNEDYAQSMFSSVLKGIQAVKKDRFFLCPGDYPLIKKQTYIDLLSRRSEIVIPNYGGRSGHPVLIASSLIPVIAGGDYSSLRDFIRAHHPERVAVADPGIHMDIDTMKDYENMLAYFPASAGAPV